MGHRLESVRGRAFTAGGERVAGEGVGVTETIVERGRQVVRLERDAIGALEQRLGPDFARAVGLIAQSRGRVIVCGVGKSGLIGRKIAATLTSTGTPATFLHPVDSVHGDLGIVGADDVAILISKSGESDELLALLAHLKGFGVRTIAITGAPTSALGSNSDVTLDAGVREEACPHDLAPTTSTTAALVLGDALAVALLQEKGFQREDFARIHPGGALGRKLVVRVEEIMLHQDLPVLPEHSTMREAIVMIAERRGIAVIVDAKQRVAGVLTAGDLSRMIERGGDLLPTPVTTVMTRQPKIAREGELASAVAYRMEQHGIMAMPVVHDDERLAGVVHLHDLLRARVV
jgi:arabinose-5-phosphate isomerase